MYFIQKTYTVKIIKNSPIHQTFVWISIWIYIISINKRV